MYALSVVLGALAVAVTCASAVVAIRMVRSRDARISDLLYRIAYLQDEADFDVRMMQHYQELYADSEDWAVDLKRQLEAKTEDHDVLLASYQTVCRQLTAARDDNRDLQHQVDSLISGSWSRDDSPEDVATCDCVQGYPLCDSCDPWGATL